MDIKGKAISLRHPDHFTIGGVYKKEDIENQQFSIFYPDKNIIELMDNHKKDYAYISIYETNLQLENSPFSFVESLKAWEHEIIFTPLEAAYFNLPNMEHINNALHIGSRYQRVEGNYAIVIIFCDASKEAIAEMPRIGMRIANFIRLTHGIGAVRKCVYEGGFSKPENKLTVTANYDINFSEINVSRDLSSYENFSEAEKSGIKDFLLNGEADVLFNRAVLEEDIKARFLFLWLSFDSTCPGKERRKLLLDKLNSPVANDEVFRMFNVRNELAHGGIVTVVSRDCTSALWAIRIAVCPNEDLQRHLCAEYEKWIAA